MADVSCRPNLSTIVRLAGCFGLSQVTVAGSTRIDPEIAREAAATVEVKRPRTLLPVLEKLKRDGWRLVGLEQTTSSVSLSRYAFQEKTALVVGNERRGLR